MATIKELKELKNTAVQKYSIACNVELIQFVKAVTDCYSYRVQVRNIDNYGANGIISHDDNISPDTILEKINEIEEKMESEFYIYVTYDGIVKWTTSY